MKVDEVRLDAVFRADLDYNSSAIFNSVDDGLNTQQ